MVDFKRHDFFLSNFESFSFIVDQKRIRCFQCGNSLIINSKTRREKYSQYNIAQLHAHFYPTCEWVKEILGVKYIAQVLHDRYKSGRNSLINDLSFSIVILFYFIQMKFKVKRR